MKKELVITHKKLNLFEWAENAGSVRAVEQVLGSSHRNARLFSLSEVQCL
jgi:hypothetical protein